MTVVLTSHVAKGRPEVTLTDGTIAILTHVLSDRVRVKVDGRHFYVPVDRVASVSGPTRQLEEFRPTPRLRKGRAAMHDKLAVAQLANEDLAAENAYLWRIIDLLIEGVK